MVGQDIIGTTLCPWCYNGIDIMISGKSGHYNVS
ncbi:hypothetical protein ES703_11911 [subsurface metagenome]